MQIVHMLNFICFFLKITDAREARAVYLFFFNFYVLIYLLKLSEYAIIVAE